MGLIAERDSGTAGYEAVEVPPRPAREGAPAAPPVPSLLRRTSARPSRRAVLYLHCADDAFVPDDLADWYTERGFHFYVADLRPREGGDRHDGGRRLSGKALRACFETIDFACGYLREAEGIDALIVSAHAAGAVAAAAWCDSRRTDRPADALVLTSPAFGRRDPGPLDITCPVLVISPPAGPAGEDGKARKRGHRAAGSVQLGAHVTWLRLADGLGPAPAAPAPAPVTAAAGREPGAGGEPAAPADAGGAAGAVPAARGGSGGIKGGIASGTVTDIAAASRSGTRLAAGGRIGASVRPVTPGRISVYPGAAGGIGIRPPARPAGTEGPAPLRPGLPAGGRRAALRPGEPRPGPADDRQRFFDEMGRWLGAYMYGQVRDQLL